MEALGGAGAAVRTGENQMLPAEEVADRCLARTGSFASPQEVIDAFHRGSWAAVILSSVNLLPFPVTSRQELLGRLEGRFVEGVAVSKLLPALSFPIETPSDLLSQLSKARRGWQDKPAKEGPSNPAEGPGHLP